MQWKRILKQKGFYLAAAIQFFALLYPHMDTVVFWNAFSRYFESGTLFYNFALSADLGLSTLLLPFIALLPAALFVGEDIQSGFTRLVLQRKGRVKYAFTRCLQAMGGAGLASFMGTALYLVLLLLICPLKTIGTGESWREGMMQGTYGFLVKPLGGFPYMLETGLRFAFAAMIWALVGVGINTLCKSKGLTLGLTFLIHFSLVYFLESTYKLSQSSWSPAVVQNPPSHETTPLIVYYLKQALYFLAAAGFSSWALWRELKQIQ